MEVTCPGCKKKLKVPDSLMGKKVKCPACKGIVEVEESLEIVMDDLPTYSSGRHEPVFPDFPTPPAAPDPGPAAPSTRAPSARMPAATGPGPSPVAPPASKPGVCPNCGFPVLPTVEHCNRCGTVLATGEQRTDKVGYHASGFKRLGKKTYWIGTAVMTVLILAGLGIMAMRAKRWADDFEDNQKKPGEVAQQTSTTTQRTQTSQTTQQAQNQTQTQSQTQSTQAQAPQQTQSAAELTRLREAVAAAFPEALDPRPLVSAEAMRKITALGPGILPVLAELRNEHGTNPEALDRIVQIAGRITTPEAMHFVADFIRHDAPPLKRLAAETLVQARATAGSAVAGLFGDESPEVRTIAVQAAGRMQVATHNQPLIELLRSDPDPTVRHRAAAALGTRVGVEDAKLALLGALEDAVFDVAAAAAESLSRSFPGADELVSAVVRLPVDPVTLASPRTFLMCRPVATNPRRPDSAQKLAEWLASGLRHEDAALVAEIMDVRNPSSRVRALERVEALGSAPVPAIVFACLLSMDDPNPLVSTPAAVTVGQLASPHSGAGLVALLASSTSMKSLEAAEILASIDDAKTKTLLEEVASGFDPQRRMLAAGVLARRGVVKPMDAVLAALRDSGEFADGVLGWTVHALAAGGTGGHDPLREAIQEHLGGRPQPLDEVFMQAAAARLGDPGKTQTLIEALPRLQGYTLMIAARLMGDLENADAVAPLKGLLTRDDTVLLREVLRSLRKLTDASLVPELLGMIPRLRPHTAKVVRDGIIAYGNDAEAVLREQLLGDLRLSMASLHLLGMMGRSVSKETAVRLVEILRDPSSQMEVKARIPETLVAITGSGETNWGWEEWAGELGITLKDIADVTRFTRRTVDWFSLELPEYWNVHVHSGSANAAGRPELRVHVFFDRQGMPVAHRSATDMRSSLSSRNHMQPEGNRYVPKQGIEMTTLRTLNTQGRPSGSIALLRVDDANTKRTTIEIYLMSGLRTGNRYAVIELSVLTEHFPLYQKMFVERIPGSVQCHE